MTPTKSLKIVLSVLSKNLPIIVQTYGGKGDKILHSGTQNTGRDYPFLFTLAFSKPQLMDSVYSSLHIALFLQVGAKNCIKSKKDSCFTLIDPPRLDPCPCLLNSIELDGVRERESEKNEKYKKTIF